MIDAENNGNHEVGATTVGGYAQLVNDSDNFHMIVPTNDERFNNSSTHFSPNNKQSVLVRRVMQDGRVLSGMDVAAGTNSYTP